MSGNLKLRAHSSPWTDGIEFLLSDGTGIASNLKFTKVSDAIQPAPTFSLRREQAQALMDNLWACGLRPTEGSGSAGAMAATQAHLNDMRRLVFNDVDLQAKTS